VVNGKAIVREPAAGVPLPDGLAVKTFATNGLQRCHLRNVCTDARDRWISLDEKPDNLFE